MRGMDRTRVYNSICSLGTLGVYERVYLFVCMNRILLWINCPTCSPHFINLCIPSMWKSKVTDNRSQQYTYFTLFCNNFTSTIDDLKLIGILFGQLEYSTNLSIYRKFTLVRNNLYKGSIRETTKIYMGIGTECNIPYVTHTGEKKTIHKWFERMYFASHTSPFSLYCCQRHSIFFMRVIKFSQHTIFCTWIFRFYRTVLCHAEQFNEHHSTYCLCMKYILRNICATSIVNH